jgi:hypothetical protein
VTNSDAFRKMAERIDANAEGDFCGAFVIVPPAQTGEGEQQAEVLLLNNRKDQAMFCGLVKGRAEVAIAELQMAERAGNQFGRR